MIKSVQSGLSALSNNVAGDYGTNKGTNIAINYVNPTKTMVLVGISFLSRVDGVGIKNLSAVVTSNYNLQISIPDTGYYTYTAVRWQVIEFY